MTSPYGWNRETTRYLFSAMFIASEIKLPIAGDWVKVEGPSSIEKLSSNQNFNSVGVSLYTDGQPTQEQIVASKKHYRTYRRSCTTIAFKNQPSCDEGVPKFQSKYADLPLRLENLNLPGKEKAVSIKEGIEEILKGDASDATFRLGKENTDLYVALIWAKNIYAAIENGIEKTIKEIQNLKTDVNALPNDGAMLDLKNQVSSKFDERERIFNSDSFYEKAPELNDYLSEIKNSIANACEASNSGKHKHSI